MQTVFENALRAPQVLREPRAYLYAALRREVGHWAERPHRERERQAERLAQERTAAEPNRDVGAVVTNQVMAR